MGQEEDDEAFLDKFVRDTNAPRPDWALQPDASGSLEAALQSVPLFMSDAPTEADLHSNPSLQALQSLLFDDGTPDQVALNFRERGSAFFRDKRFHDARLSYTQGIETKGVSKEVLSSLLANRAAAFLHLDKWTDALNDCKRAVKLDPDNDKALLRGLKCAVKLNDKQFIAQVDLGAISDRALAEDAQRALATATNTPDHGMHDYLGTMLGLQHVEHCEDQILAALPSIDPSSLPSVHMAGGQSVWPMVVFYPEHGQCDFIQEFHEHDPFSDHLERLFETSPQWDPHSVYTPRNLCLYMAGQDGTLHKLAMAQTLRSVFPAIIKSYHRGILAVYVLPKDRPALRSEFESRFD